MDVQVRGSEDAQVCKRVWRVKRASMLIRDCPAVGRSYTGAQGSSPGVLGLPVCVWVYDVLVCVSRHESQEGPVLLPWC